MQSDEQASTKQGIEVGLLDTVRKLNEPKNTPNESEADKAMAQLKSILDIQDKLRRRKAEEIEFSKPILYHDDKPVIYPYTINIIQGQTGLHKSRFAETMASALIKADDCAKTFLGFRAGQGNDSILNLVDSERNLNDQLPYAIQKILINAGYDKSDNPENFKYVSLLLINRKDRFSALENYLTYERQSTSKHLVLILDVATDCITDFNRVDDSMMLVDMMNTAINQQNVTFICIIHENPNGAAKARGHLGTELMNKSSVIFQLSFEKDSSNNDTDLIKVKYLKCRSTKRYEPFYVKYSDQEKTLILADNVDVQEVFNSRKHKANTDDVVEFLEVYLAEGEMKNADLMEKLTKDFQTTPKTLNGRIRDIMNNKVQLHNTKGELFYLQKDKREKEVWYRLEPCNCEASNFYESEVTA